jgi:hypothetical protein
MQELVVNPTGKSIHGDALGHGVRPGPAASTGKSAGPAARSARRHGDREQEVVELRASNGLEEY